MSVGKNPKIYPKNYRGEKGSQIEMFVATQGSQSFLQTKYDTQTSWQNLLALSLLQGSNGDPVVLRSTNDALQWKYSSETAWQNLMFYTDMPSGGGMAIKGSGTSIQSTGTVEFQNANGISWNLSEGSMQVDHALQYTSATSLITSDAMNTTERANYLGSAQSSDYRHTSADSQMQFTSANSLLQYLSATSGITSAALHTSLSSNASTNAVHTSNSSLFRFTSQNSQLQFTSANSNFLGSAATQSFRHTTADSQLQFTSANTLFLGTAATQSFMHTSGSSAYTSTWFANSATTKFAGTDTTFNGANLSASMTFNSNGLNLSMSAAAPGGGGGFAAKGSGTYTQNTGTIEFSAANGITFIADTNKVSVTHALQYTSDNSLSLGTGATQSFMHTSASSGYTSVWQALSLTSNSLGTGATASFFYTSASSLLQHTTATSAITSNALNTSVSRIPWIAGSAASSITNGGVVFSNLNGVSFGLNGSTMTASHNAYSATSQLSATFITSAFSASIQLTATFGQTANMMNTSERNNYLYTSNSSNNTSVWFANSATTKFAGIGTTFNGANLSASMTLNSNGLQMSMSAAAPGGGGGFAAKGSGTYTQNTGTIEFTAANGVTFALTAGTMSLTHGLQYTSATSAITSNAMNTSDAGNVYFNNANGVTFGSSVSSISTTITASVNAGGGGVAIANSQITYTSGTVLFRGTNVTINTSAGGQFIDISVAAPGAAAEANWITLAGNVANNSSASGSTIQWYAGNNITFAGSNNSQVSVFAAGPQGLTYNSYCNRQLGASSQVSPGQNSVWFVPFRIENYISASTLLQMASFTGTITTASTGQFEMTYDQMIYSQNSASTTKFDSMWSAKHTMTCWISGTSSNSVNYNGSTLSSAGSNLLTASVMGYRMLTANIGSTLTPGLYMFGMRMSTSSANVSAVMRTYGIVMDAPAYIAKGYLVAATATNSGYQDGGVFSVTSAAMPASMGLSEIRVMNDVVPWFKIGAI